MCSLLFGVAVSASLPIFVTYQVSVSATLAQEAEEKKQEEKTEEVPPQIEE